MKKLLLILCVALAFTACEARPDTEPDKPESAASVSIMDEQSSEAEDAPESEPESEASEEQDDSGYTAGPYDEMLIVYGGVLEKPHGGDPYIRASEVGFYYIDDWNSPEEIESGNYYSWFLSMMWKEDLTQAEKEEKYKSPVEGDTGWFFPEDIYEELIREYFDVSVEHLRSERHIYDPELHGYYLGAGGGIGERPEIELVEAVDNGDTVSLHIKLIYGAAMSDDKKILTVGKNPNGGFRFLSCVTGA